jgi:hypothetical protein
MGCFDKRWRMGLFHGRERETFGDGKIASRCMAGNPWGYVSFRLWCVTKLLQKRRKKHLQGNSEALE